MWQKYIEGQYRRPSGLVGRWIGGKMAAQHQPENRWTIVVLDAQPQDRLLEIGFGPGYAVQELARHVTEGLIAGADASKTMVEAARRRNAEAVRQGRVDLRYGDAAHLPFEDNTFDKAYSIHSIYFWRDPMAALREIRRVLKPGGLLALTILPKEKWGPNPDGSWGTPDCTPYSGAELGQMLVEAGFETPDVRADLDEGSPSNFTVLGYAAK